MAQSNTTLTDETAKQQAEGTSPVTDDATANAERAVDKDSAPYTRAAPAHAVTREEYDTLLARVTKLELSLRHWV